MENAFDLSQFDEYREDNRREVKKAEGGLPVSLWDTYSSLFSQVFFPYKSRIFYCLLSDE